MFEVRGLSVAYGPAAILHGVSVEVGERSLVSLVGPNGAGKTTFLRAVAGLVRWEQKALRRREARLSGEIWFQGERIERLLPHDIAARGLILCPERRRPFREMSVRDNLLAGAYLVRSRRAVREKLEDVYRLFPILKERQRQRSGTLSGGEQQMLAIGRALMAAPNLLLIDEPSTGLAPLVKRAVFERIREIKDLGLAVLLVEQDASLALSISDRGYVLSHGCIIAQGTREALLAEEVIRKSFLGL